MSQWGSDVAGRGMSGCRGWEAALLGWWGQGREGEGGTQERRAGKDRGGQRVALLPLGVLWGLLQPCWAQGLSVSHHCLWPCLSHGCEGDGETSSLSWGLAEHWAGSMELAQGCQERSRSLCLRGWVCAGNSSYPSSPSELAEVSLEEKSRCYCSSPLTHADSAMKQKASNISKEGEREVMPELWRSGKGVVRVSVYGCVKGEAGASQLPGAGPGLSSVRGLGWGEGRCCLGPPRITGVQGQGVKGISEKQDKLWGSWGLAVKAVLQVMGGDWRPLKLNPHSGRLQYARDTQPSPSIWCFPSCMLCCQCEMRFMMMQWQCFWSRAWSVPAEECLCTLLNDASLPHAQQCSALTLFQKKMHLSWNIWVVTLNSVRLNLLQKTTWSYT